MGLLASKINYCKKGEAERLLLFVHFAVDYAKMLGNNGHIIDKSLAIVYNELARDHEHCSGNR